MTQPFRKHERIEKRLPISVNKSAAMSADLSTAGFCLESPVIRRRGDVVTGFVLHGDKELTWSGRVQWVQVGDPMASTWHRMGVEFIRVSPGLRALLSILTRR
ncbi:MAG: PilZ domain-containing protein [Myxococcaceae bacterium]